MTPLDQRYSRVGMIPYRGLVAKRQQQLAFARRCAVDTQEYVGGAFGRHGVILVEAVGDHAEIVRAVARYIHRYVEPYVTAGGEAGH